MVGLWCRWRMEAKGGQMTHDELHYATDVTPDGAWNPVLTSTDIKFAAIMLREGLANDTR